MNITSNWLQKQTACPDGIVWWEKQKETDGLKVVKKLIRTKKLDWANWLIVRIISYKEYISYGVYAAEQVIDIYEREYPNDKRPRDAIEAAKKCIENPSEENKRAAARAAEAAAEAARAARAAEAAEAAEAEMKLKILKYGIKLLEA